MRFLTLSGDGEVPKEVTTYLLPHEQAVLALRKHPAVLLPPVIVAIQPEWRWAVE